MTTEVIIKANHGWPVLVQPLIVNGSMGFGAAVIVAVGAEHRTSVHSSQDLLIHEIQSGDAARVPVNLDPMLVHFTWEHLPPHLQVVSMPFAALAQRIVETLPGSAERTVCLRKLLEAKDCAVRAAVVR